MKKGRFVPLQQVGAEGVIELILLACLVLPVVQHLPGSAREDVLAAVDALAHSPLLAGLCFATFVGLALVNPLGMAIAKEDGSVLRVFADVSRSAVVWAVELAVRWADPGSARGEAWTALSWLELAGFVLVCICFLRGGKRKRNEERNSKCNTTKHSLKFTITTNKHPQKVQSDARFVHS